MTAPPFIPNDPPAVLARVTQSIGTALDWLEAGGPDDLLDVAELLHFCLDDLQSIPETRVPGFPGHEALAGIRHAECS